MRLLLVGVREEDEGEVDDDGDGLDEDEEEDVVLALEAMVADICGGLYNQCNHIKITKSTRCKAQYELWESMMMVWDDIQEH